MRPHLAIPLTTLAATLALAGTAAAADVRYAAPAGDGPPAACLLADPCSLKNAVEFSAEDDTVRVLDGTYVLKLTGVTSEALTRLTIAYEGNTIVDGTLPAKRATICSHVCFTCTAL